MSDLSIRIAAVLAADGDTFESLARIADLDPTRDFRDCNLDGVNFAGSDLSGFDFSGSMLRNCQFENAILADADFSGAQTDPGALQRASDWATSLAAKQAEYERDWQGSDLKPGNSGIGDSIRSIQTVFGIENQLRYVINRYKMDPSVAIMDAAAEAPIHESIAGAVAASGVVIRLTDDAADDGQVALAELRTKLSRRDLRMIERGAATSPTFGLCFSAVSLLVRFDKIGPSNLQRASQLLDFGRRGYTSDDAMDFATKVKPNSAMFEWHIAGMTRALNLDRRAPTEYQILLMLFLAASPDQMARAFRFMGDRQTYISTDIAYALARTTIHELPSRERPGREVINSTIWRAHQDVGRYLIGVRGQKSRDASSIAPTTSSMISRAIQSAARSTLYEPHTVGTPEQVDLTSGRTYASSSKN